ncbi:hypothetical protein GCM10011487_12090 [Steroidobacter agaridevorans]|uniref:HNH nuclease domain-containing protein n=1 Tax=Steroidobacter agaridevorans TaxID=2695856 RepID=A0A829Y7I8_9GAMM|nr:MULTISPECIES: HNH endonuclease [Steroidobacteraceae]GFE79209.1 hypothetical protein GCM10011487_12090 [Steroidobacter agaridevorans]
MRDALRRLSQGEAHPFDVSTGWDVVWEHARYPQKAVLGLAAGRLAERPLGPYDFKAGECRRILTRLGFAPVPKRSGGQESDDADDAAEADLRQRTGLGPTEKASLIRARRGQGIFRQNLERVEKRCRITGLRDRIHLRASHIKPWRSCSDHEKLDGNNGLLLSPHADHLLDRGFISFEDSGALLIADALDTRVLDQWRISQPRNASAFRAAQCKYLSYHREHIFLGRED